MAAQEFSSPGEHMASMSSGSAPGYVDTTGHSGTNPQNAPYSNIIYAPINEAYKKSYGFRASSVRDYDDFQRASMSYNKAYMDYNDRLFNSAKEYDEYMSNTAIQRQVKDLIAAGLNPVLATRLGGATYHGVSAPYVSLQPGSSLQAYTGYDASIYGSSLSSMTQLEVAELQTNSQQLIASYNKTMERIINGDNILADKEMVNLKRDADEYLENLSHLNNVELQNFGFENQKSLSSYKYNLDKAWFNYKNYGTELPIINTERQALISQLSRIIPGAKGLLVD